jgi:hypothetical protein
MENEFEPVVFHVEVRFDPEIKYAFETAPRDNLHE